MTPEEVFKTRAELAELNKERDALLALLDEHRLECRKQTRTQTDSSDEPKRSFAQTLSAMSILRRMFSA